MNAETMRQLDGPLWNEINPHDCPCRGTGWMVSDWDTSHRCQTHYLGQAHPEDERVEDWSAITIANQRTAWRAWQELSGHPREVFRRLVEDVSPTLPANPRAWLDTARRVSQAAQDAALEAAAASAGYSCRLEALMAAEAAVEAQERATGREATYGSPERAQADGWYTR
jgi:hypothetical protein